jgi:hypothetical protein
MSTPEQTYKKLSDAVAAMRLGHQAAKKRAAANDKLPALARTAGRDEYIRELQELQAAGQAVLDSTTDQEEREVNKKRVSRQSHGNLVVNTLGPREAK